MRFLAVPLGLCPSARSASPRHDRQGPIAGGRRLRSRLPRVPPGSDNRLPGPPNLIPVQLIPQGAVETGDADGRGGSDAAADLVRCLHLTCFAKLHDFGQRFLRRRGLCSGTHFPSPWIRFCIPGAAFTSNRRGNKYRNTGDVVLRPYFYIYPSRQLSAMLFSGWRQTEVGRLRRRWPGTFLKITPTNLRRRGANSARLCCQSSRQPRARHLISGGDHAVGEVVNIQGGSAVDGGLNDNLIGCGKS